jgi:serine/threonine protein kinase
MASAGRSFGHIRYPDHLGAGGMGEVFRAQDQRLGRIVALKTSHTQFSDRMMPEARAAAALNHPHIATLHDVGPDYLVMEHVEGESLRGPLPVSKALVDARQILDALAAAHRNGITHCDLKPANIMVSKSGFKLLDFGLAQMKHNLKLAEDAPTVEMSREGGISGTLQYMAPEQFEGKQLDAHRYLCFRPGNVRDAGRTHAFEGSNPGIAAARHPDGRGAGTAGNGGSHVAEAGMGDSEVSGEGPR